MLGNLQTFILLFALPVLSIDQALWNIDTSSRRFAYNAATHFDAEGARHNVYKFERSRSIRHTLPGASLFPSHQIPVHLKTPIVYAPESYEVRKANCVLLVGLAEFGKGPNGDDVSTRNLHLDYPAYISTGGTLGFTQDKQSFKDMEGIEVVFFHTKRALQIKKPKQLPADYTSSTKNILFVQSFYSYMCDITAAFLKFNRNFSLPLNPSGHLLTNFRMNIFANFHPTKLQDVKTKAMMPHLEPLFPLIFKATVEACLTTFKATIRGGHMSIDDALKKLSIFFPNSKITHLTAGTKRFVHWLIPPFHIFHTGQPIFLYKDPSKPGLPAWPLQYHKAGAVICYHVKDEHHEPNAHVASIIEFDPSFPSVEGAEKILEEMVASFVVPVIDGLSNQSPISRFDELMIASAMAGDLFEDSE